MIQQINILQQNYNNSKKEIVTWFDQNKDTSQIYKVTDKTNLIKGKFYKFLYKPKNPQKFYDSFPLILALGESEQSTQTNKLDLCLNFNYLPRDVKVFIIKKLFKVFELKINSQTKLVPLQALYQKGFDVDYYDLKDILKGINISFAIQNYIPFNRGDTYILSLENLYRIPFLENYNFVGTNFQTIEGMYYQSLNKKNL